MDQFIMAGLIGAIVVIVSYTTIQVIDITDKYLDNRKIHGCIEADSR